MTPTAMFKIAVGAIHVISLAVDVADKFVDVLKKAGVIKNSSNSDELGARVLRGRELGITPEKVETMKDYEEYARQIDAIELPQNQSYSLKEKHNAANEFITGAMNMKYGQKSSINNFLVEVDGHSNFYSPERINSYLNCAEQKNLNMENIGSYFDSKLDSMQDIRHTESILIAAEKLIGVNEQDAKKNFETERSQRAEKGLR